MCVRAVHVEKDVLLLLKKVKVTPLKFEVKIWIIYIRIQNGVNI